MPRTPFDATWFCPPAELREVHTLLPFKLALVEQWGVAEGFRIYCDRLGLPKSCRLERRRIESMHGFAERNGLSFREIYPEGECFDIPPPPIIGDSDARSMTGESRSFFVTCLADARVEPHSALVHVGSRTLLDYQSDELTRFDDFPQLDPCIFHAEGDVAWVIVDDRAAIEVDEAFGALIGPRSPHFGHWLWEYLPKYIAAVASGALPKVPILVNDCVGKKMRDALELFVPEGVDVIEVPSRPFSAVLPVRVRRLWWAPNLFYEPYYEVVNERYPGPDHRCFPPARFRAVADAMNAAGDRLHEGFDGSERLYLARKRHLHRRIVNGASVEQLMASLGFTIFYPEDHPFAEQVRRVRSARYIVGPDGSQMLTGLFARRGTKICFLNHAFVCDVLAGAFQFSEAGLDVTIFTGAVIPGYHRFNTQLDFIHENYFIDPNLLAHFLDGWLGGTPATGSPMVRSA